MSLYISDPFKNMKQESELIVTKEVIPTDQTPTSPMNHHALASTLSYIPPPGVLPFSPDMNVGSGNTAVMPVHMFTDNCNGNTS
jgi:hypothetical protein